MYGMAVLTRTGTNAQTIETINEDDAMPCHAMPCDAYIPCIVSNVMYVRYTTIKRDNQILIRGSKKSSTLPLSIE